MPLRQKEGLAGALTLAFGLILLHMPSGLPAPLYPRYQAELGITAAEVSMLFAAYVAGCLIGLAVMPRLVRHSFVLVWACLLSIAADVFFLVAKGAPALFAGHVLQGIVLGVFTGVVPVVLASWQTTQVNQLVGRITTSANAIGLAAGPLWSGLLLQYAPWPGDLVWIVQIVATVLVLPFLIIPSGQQSTSSRMPSGQLLRAMGSSRAGKAAIIVGFCAFSSGGLIASLGSTVLDSIIGVKSSSVHGVLVSLCFIMSAIFGALKVRRSDTHVIRYGLYAVAAGSVLLVVSVMATSLPLMILATIVCGVGQGIGLQGATQLIATEDRTGAAVAFFFILCYLGTTIASLGVGSVIVLIGLSSAFNAYSLFVALLCFVGVAYTIDSWSRND